MFRPTARVLISTCRVDNILRWAQFQVANEDYSAVQSNPNTNVMCPLLTTNSVMAEYDPEPVVSNFNPRNFFPEDSS